MGTCTRKERGKSWYSRHLGIVQQGAIWRNTTAGQWARIHLQMESSLFVWARFQEREKKKGEKPGGDLNALIFTLGRAVLLESRMSREGKGILGCEYCVLVASNANIDKGMLGAN